MTADDMPLYPLPVPANDDRAHPRRATRDQEIALMVGARARREATVKDLMASPDFEEALRKAADRLKDDRK